MSDAIDLYASLCASPESTLVSATTSPAINDKTAIQLLSKLDEGLEILATLRSILTLKTAELNELVGQLELTNQAIINVEQTTEQTESMLKDMGIVDDRLLIEAHASLDRAIKSASSLCRPQQQHNMRQRLTTTRMRCNTQPKPLLRQLNSLLRELELDPNQFMERLDDVQGLKMIKVDLDIAKTIALAAKNSLKRRTILLKSTARHSNHAEISMLGEKIRKSVNMWKSYARDAPMLVDGKDILDILSTQDGLLAKDLQGPGRHRMSMDSGAFPSTPKSVRDPSRHTRTSSLHAGVPIAKSTKTTSTVTPAPAPAPATASPPSKKRIRPPAKTSATARMRPSTHKANNKPVVTCPSSHPASPLSVSTTTIVEPPKKTTSKSLIQRGPGSALRIRSMLAKRALAVA